MPGQAHIFAALIMASWAPSCDGFSLSPALPGLRSISRPAGVSAGHGRGTLVVPRRDEGSRRPPALSMQVASSDRVQELEKVINAELSRSSVVEALDRSVELFSNNMPNRPWESLFTSLAASESFRKSVWAKETVKLEDGEMASLLSDCFTMSDIERHAGEYPSSYAAQGALSPDGNGGWYMKRVGGQQAATASTRFEDVQESLKSGTVVLNSAGAYISPLASVSLAVLEATQLPVGLNLYITAPGMTTSAPPHTDKQDVFVLQAQGAKHWRVFAPPPPASKQQADPYARGKGPDQLSLDELEAPLIDTVLSPGQLLYMPAGFPHTTDTVQGGCDVASIHLTVGIDTHIWGLDYAFMRQCVLQRAGQDIDFGGGGGPTSLSPELYAVLHEPLPVGFMAADALPPLDSSMSRTQRQQAAASALVDTIANELGRRMALCEPERFGGDDGGKAIVEELKLVEAANRFVVHYQMVMGVQRRMYLDGKIGISGSQNSLQRVSQYMAMLDQAMEQILGWAQGSPSPPRSPQASAAGAPPSAAGESKGMGMGKAKGKAGGKKKK